MADNQRTLAGFDEEPQPETSTPPRGKGRKSSSAEKPLPAMTPRQKDPNSPPTAWLIDSHSLIYQVFHAMPEMSSPSGQPVGALHGFVRDVVDILELHQPDYLVCIFDAPGPNFRHELYTDYKAHREEMPADLQLQIPNIERMLTAMGVCSLSLSGFEADDLLATLARQIDERGGECFLVTSDKDCRQLITPRVKMFNLRKNEIYDSAALQTTWGIRPEQVVDFQALVGDSVDNVPGVPLIGPKAAQDLLNQFQTLEGVYANLAALKGKKKENLITFREQAYLSRQLVELDKHVPLEFDWETARPRPFAAEPVAELCREFGFRQLAQRLARLSGNSLLSPAEGEDSSEESQSTAPAIEPWDATYRSVNSWDDLRQLVAEMATQTEIVIDTETTSVSPRLAKLVGLSFAWKPGEAYYLPILAPPGELQFDEREALAILQPILGNPAIRKTGQNLKYDLIVLRNAGVELAGVAFDTMVADYLLDPGERTHNMDELSLRYLHHATIKISSLIGSGKNQKRMDEVPLAAIVPYAAEDADVPLRLQKILQAKLEQQNLLELFSQLEMPLVEVLADLEFNGIRLDRAHLAQLSERFANKIAAVEQEIYQLAGREFNIDSRQQLGQILFNELKLPILKRTATGPSTDAEVLEELAAQHPLPAKIVEYRQAAKLKGTYTDALPLLIHPETGRVHTSFKQDVTATGRLSSQDPNLQNIPIRTEEGRAIRSAFVAGYDDWQLLTADYSQIELRVLAHFSGDATLKQAFAEDRDIHTLVASEVYSVPLAEVTREQRRNAKAVNFGVIYGQSAFGLAKSLGIDQKEAARFIAAYFAKYPGVDEFMTRTLLTCREQGYVSTIMGRKRAVHGVRDPRLQADSRQRNLPERIAINTVIQGSAADIIKQAMIRLHRRLKSENFRAKMLLQIHDELVFEFPSEERERLTTLVAEEMSTAVQLIVPLKVDLKTGRSWGECEAVSD